VSIMPSLTIPLSIWLSSTPAERDGFYLSAGFDPNLPVQDAGTDTVSVRFSQLDPASMNGAASPVPTSVSAGTPEAGDDLRDFNLISAQPDISGTEFGNGKPPTGAPMLPAVVGVSSLAVRLAPGLRPSLMAWASSLAIGGRVAFGNLPWWLRSGLTAVGLGGVTIAIDEVLEAGGLPSLPGDFIGPKEPDIQVRGSSPMQQVQVVGSWVANGVTFYRLADGKLAVQNKKGRWKVWRPKKPIVLYADGASNLKTMLRADKALNKQAKKIAAMLNRRAPKRRSSTSSSSTPIVLGNNARIVDV